MPHLSIVIPAYNEKERLPRTLERMLPYLRAQDVSFEIVVSDDGSTDETAALVRAMSKEAPELRLLSDGVNRGRGAAVKRGIADARGDLILETDSDGSVADEAIGRFVRYLDAHPEAAVVFGSREIAGARIVVWQPPLRVFLGYGLLYLTRFLFGMWSTTDFTLGFKMYRRDAARDIFAHQYDPYFVAEAEKCFIAKLRGHTFVELPVTWTDDPNSRVRPARDVPRALKGLAAIMWRYVRGVYRK